VKTSTGFGDGSATAEAVAVMVETVGEVMKIKASGGVRTYEDAVAFLEQGCSRIGTSGGTRPICEGAPNDSTSEY
jgi:deoxyribose-phosphate aldolase